VNDTQRAAFEAWLKGPHPNNWNDSNYPLTVGEHIAASNAWDAACKWQAAQAADAGREAVAYETTDANGDQELLYASYLAKYATEEERDRFKVGLYYEPNAYRLAAINAELVEALEAMVKRYEIYEKGYVPGTLTLFRQARAALSRAKEQKS
jgi:hypothetical protein